MTVSTTGPFKASGFSLIELMVAMLISLIIMAGVINSFIASRDAYHYNEQLAFIQENARFAIGKLSADIREAGNFGCRNDSPHDLTTGASDNDWYANNLVSALNQSSNVFYKRTGLQGFSQNTAGIHLPSNVNVSNVVGDAVLVRRGDNDNALTVKNHDGPKGHVFTLTAKHSYKPGTLMVYADANCRYQGIFQLAGPAESSLPSDQVDHQAGVSGAAPGNKTVLLLGQLAVGGGSFLLGDYSECNSTTDCSWWPGGASEAGAGTSAAVDYLPGSLVMPMSSNLYYVARSTVDPNMNSLYVVGLDNGGALASAQELVLGVDDMRIFYGVDTDAIADGMANRYVTAADIGTHDYAALGATNNYLVWNRVVSVRVQLLLSSRNRVLTNPAQGFTWDDDSDALTEAQKHDGYLRQLISTTVQLRDAFKG